MNLFVEIDTDRMRSTFTAIGLARLFSDLPPAGSGIAAVRLMNQGSAYQLFVPYDRQRAHDYLIARDGRLPEIIPAIKKKFSAGEIKELEADPDSPIQYKYTPRRFTGTEADYEREQGYKPPGKASAPRVEGGEGERSADYPLWAHLSSYFGKGSAMRDGYPNLLHSWHAHEGESGRLLLDLVLDMYGEYPNNVDDALARWKRNIQPQITYADYQISAAISALAVVSPSTSKGLFSETTSRGLSENTPEHFWLPFYFAFAGYMVAGMPFTLGTDVALYYPLPQDIAFSDLKNVMTRYRDEGDAKALYRFSNALPRIKLDVLAHIAYYKSMVEHFRSRHDVDNLFDTITHYGGFVGYYYKDAGGTQIPFDETVFALPRWLPLESGRAALDEARDVLESHHALIDRVRGKPPKYQITGDELVVLDDYRHFIATGEENAWIEFTIAYNRYYFQQMVEQPSLRALTLDLFEKTLINAQSEETKMDDRKDFRPIIENEGFRNVARAIRSCTITARYLADVQKRQIGFKVRHGLGDDLLRQAHDPDAFIFELSAFLHDYARESSNVQADTGESRPFITERDIGDVMKLIAEYGSQTVASLLVAVGYAPDYTRRTENS